MKKPEYRQLFSEKFKGENNPMYGVKRFGKDNPMYGTHRTEEQKLKQSKLMSGEGNPCYGRTGLKNPNSKPIVVIKEDNEKMYFCSIKDFANYLGYSSTACVSLWISGKRNTYIKYGYKEIKFVPLEEYLNATNNELNKKTS